LLDHCNCVVHLGQVTFLLEDKQGSKFEGVDNVNFYHYPSYIFFSKIISSKAFNLLNPQFYLTFVNKYILGYIDLNIPLIPIFVSIYRLEALFRKSRQMSDPKLKLYSFIKM